MEQLTFCFEGHNVRFVGTSEKPEWVAKDVCVCLGLSDTSKALETLESTDKDTKIVRTPSGEQEMLTVTESGLYALIFKSRKSESKRFKRWVFEEVLPSIRKTGSYSIKPLSPTEALLQTVQALVELERKQTQLQEEQIRLAVEQQVTKVLAEQANSKVELVDTKVTNLEAEVNALKSILNQPIPTCNQTARQRIVEIAQLTADLLTKKGVYPTIQAAIAEIWSRINLKVRNSSLRVDLSARKANNLKRYKTDLRNWESIGKPKGQKPVKKSYALTVPAVIEELKIEQDVLRCAVSVSTEAIS